MDSGRRISVDWVSLSGQTVELWLREQAALTRNRAYARMYGPASDVAAAAAPLSARPRRSRWKFSADSVLHMSIFGLVGGLFAWLVLTLVLNLERSHEQEVARELVAAMAQISQAVQSGRVDAAQGEAAIAEIRRAGQRNPYFVISSDTTVDRRARQIRQRDLMEYDDRRELVIRILGFGASGFLIALFLAVAEPARNRNIVGAITAGATAGTAGLAGGVIVAFLAERVFTALGGTWGTFGINTTDATRQLAARAVVWGALGLLFTLGPAVAMRSSRKFLVASLGGLLGGLVGGVLVETVGSFSVIPRVGELLGFISIGVVAGAGAGMVERIAGAGVLRVTAGLLKGKQFMLYRPCTFIGAAANCHIFMFRDPQVGRRHAAIHRCEGGGFEIENLPLGQPTEINGVAMNTGRRRRLRHGDVIRIGATTLLYEERAAATTGFGMVHASLLSHMHIEGETSGGIDLPMRAAVQPARTAGTGAGNGSRTLA